MKHRNKNRPSPFPGRMSWEATKPDFSFYSARNARIASAVLATAVPSVRLSVCLSVRHTPVLCQNDGT